MRGTFACCAWAASGAASILRVRVAMNPTVLYHMVVFSHRPPANHLVQIAEDGLDGYAPVAGYLCRGQASLEQSNRFFTDTHLGFSNKANLSVRLCNPSRNH